MEVKLDSFSRKGKHHPQEESATREQEALGCEEELGERARELACVQCSWDAVDHCNGAGPGAVNVVPFAGFQIATEEFPVN